MSSKAIVLVIAPKCYPSNTIKHQDTNFKYFSLNICSQNSNIFKVITLATASKCYESNTSMSRNIFHLSFIDMQLLYQNTTLVELLINF